MFESLTLQGQSGIFLRLHTVICIWMWNAFIIVTPFGQMLDMFHRHPDIYCVQTLVGWSFFNLLILIYDTTKAQIFRQLQRLFLLTTKWFQFFPFNLKRISTKRIWDFFQAVGNIWEEHCFETPPLFYYLCFPCVFLIDMKSPCILHLFPDTL